MGSSKAHKDKDVAHHVRWQFRPEAIFLRPSKPPTINFFALATDLRDWLTQKGQLKYSTSFEKPDRFANPHTQPRGLLNIVYASVINDAHVFANDNSVMDAVEAEIERVRLFSELTLYSARICECLIKQLVFLTTLANQDYKTASLGDLLSRWCDGCEDCNGVRHRVSLLGSLAHRYNLCQEYEKCLGVRTRMVNRRRNFEAAHSGVMKFYPKDAGKTRKKFNGEVERSVTDFLHMVGHIADIEQQITQELKRDHLRLILQPTHPQIVAKLVSLSNRKGGSQEKAAES